MDESARDEELEINPVYFREKTCEIPRYKLPEHGVLPRTALQVVRDELILDGNARLNLATFVTTWMEPEAELLMAETAAKNMIDKDEYPQTAELERRCVNILSHLWNAPDRSQATGCSTTGSSEACMLGGMALLWRWRARRQAAGLDTAKPNLVMGTNVQVCWEKFCRYWQVEPHYVPMVPGRLHLGPAEAAAKCDENTIGVVAIMGSTMDGSYEPVLEISQALDRLEAQRGFDIPVHVDGASGGFIAPFLHRTWSGTSGCRGSPRSTPRATSSAWCIPGWAGSSGGPRTRCPTTWSSRSTTWAARCPPSRSTSPGPARRSPRSTTTSSGSAARATGTSSRPARTSRSTCPARSPRWARSSCSPTASDLPVFAFKLRDDVTEYSVFDLSERLRQRGWQVPAYTFPEDMTDTAVMRIVVRNGFSMDLANLLLDDMRLHVRVLEHHPQTQPPPEIQAKRQSFKH